MVVRVLDRMPGQAREGDAVRWRDRPQEFDPRTGKPKEPIPDTLRNERRQFLNLQLMRAIRSGKPYNEKKVVYHAKIDWKRRQQTEKRRQARTSSLELLPVDPEAPDPIAAFDALEQAMHLLDRLPEHERNILTAMYVGCYSRSEIALALHISVDDVDKTRQRAIRRLQSPPTKE